MMFKKRIIFAYICLFFIFFIIVSYVLSRDITNYTNKTNITTTTTTTPTPPELLLKPNIKPNISIERYNASQVHADIMKSKIKKMTQRFSGHSPRNIRFNLTNSNLHMFYTKYIDKSFLQDKKYFSKFNMTNENIDQNLVLQNLKIANEIGSGALFIEYPYLPIMDQYETGENMFNMIFKLSSRFNVKISILIKNHFRRTIQGIRENIKSFLEIYGNNPALYRYYYDSKSLPIIYIMDSYNIPSEDWSDILLPNGIASIRNSKIDAIIMGHLRTEEDVLDIKKSGFDGIFTCCYNNGEYFGSTWKNWESLSIWAKARNYLWSPGISESVEGIIGMKAAFNTILRSIPRPNFVLLNNMQYRNEIITMTNTWNAIWLNVSNVNIKYL